MPYVLTDQSMSKVLAGGESLETSSMHLDLLAFLRGINGYTGNLAAAMVSRTEQQHQGVLE